MPTNNEGTSFGDVLEQSPSYEDFNDASSTNSKEDRKDHHIIERENIINNLWIRPVKSEISFESTPVRSNHEIFLRDFFEIMLQDAVFDVSKYLFIHYIFKFSYLHLFPSLFLNFQISIATKFQ